MTDRKLSMIDLFSGAGGFSTGFLMSGGFEVKAGVDNVGFMEKSFITNHPGGKFYQSDIRKEVPSDILDIKPDVVIGSPPCQGFSDARGTRYRLDRKNDLVFCYFDWIEQISPKIAIMENVKGMTTIGRAWKSLDTPGRKEEIDFMDLLANTAEEKGYTFKSEILNSRDFGVPQERERVFCLMVRDDIKKKFNLPKPTHYTPGPTEETSKTLDEFIQTRNEHNRSSHLPYTSVCEAICRLPKPYEYQSENGFDTLSPINYIHSEPKTWFQSLILDSEKIYNHIARFPRDDNELEMISRIPEGLTYRSDRRGAKHIGVWDLFAKELTNDERDLLKEISRLRTLNGVKTKKGRYTEGYVPITYLKNFSEKTIKGLVKKQLLKNPKLCFLTEKGEGALKDSLQYRMSSEDENNINSISKRDITVLERLSSLQKELKDSKGVPDYRLGIQANTLKRLVRSGWIDTIKAESEFDLTAKAGLRGRYSRIAMDKQSRTLMTGFTNLSEILHPIEDRGLSLREGARLMSFPDSFVFYGSFSQISLQIGNAVAPLVARQIALQIIGQYPQE